MKQQEFGVFVPRESVHGAARPGVYGSAAAARAAARKRKRSRALRNRILFGVGCCAAAVLLTAGGFGLMGLVSSAAQEPGADVPLTTQAAQLEIAALTEAEQAAVPAQTPQPPALGDEYVFSAADPRLVLVNNNVPLSAEYAPEVSVADPATGKSLQTEAAAAYVSMAAAAKADGVALMLCSGYRDYEYQKNLFEVRMQKYLDQGKDAEQAEALAKTIVAMPGCSEHQTGLAADIVTESYQGLDSGFAKTDAFAWLSAHAAEYGFILRYPEERQSATGIVYEPWHWRYVGAENARAITQSGLSLEEFLAVNELQTG